MDGGICSQMHFYMIGHYFEEKGFTVKYDLSWFLDCGMDNNGKYVRNYDLLKAFPNLLLQEAKKHETFFYKIFCDDSDYFAGKNYEWMQANPPVFLNSYYHTPPYMYDIVPDLFNLQDTVLNEKSRDILSIIRSTENSVAVHVRRGNLAAFNAAYGEPVDASYFKNCIDYIEKETKAKCFYYFFSDESQWVKEILINKLDLVDNCFVVDVNGSEHGYMDLLLIAACQHQITSKGSLGKYGALLNKNEQKIITICDDEYERDVWEGCKNVVFISPAPNII